MEEEDEIDVLGEFNLENLLTKNEEQISCYYDGDHQLGLHCDSQWMLDSATQSCWYDNKSDPQSSLAGFPAINSSESCDPAAWSDKEQYLLDKGLELFGRSWSRLAQYIGTKNSGQVKSFVKAMGVSGAGKSSVSTSSYGVDSMDLNFTELIDDMDIPASMEEVIAAVSTAQPTVLVPTSQKEVSTVPNTITNRKIKHLRVKNSSSLSKRNYIATSKPKKNTEVYDAKDIKSVLTVDMQQDSIVLPSGEEVIRLRHDPSLSEGSDVDVDIDSDNIEESLPLIENCLTEALPKLKENPTQLLAESKGSFTEVLEFKNENIRKFPESEEKWTSEIFMDEIGKEVSVFTEDCIESKKEINEGVEKERQVFKGDLVTPSGKVMTIVVDDMRSSHSDESEVDSKPPQIVSKYLSSIQEKLNNVYRLPPPTQELTLEPQLVTQEEKLLHPEFFSNNYHGCNKYVKIRNYIVACWKNSKPTYLTKTSVRHGLKSCGDVNLVGRIHAYLEQKGYINFGCDQCHYNQVKSVTDSNTRPDVNHIKSCVNVATNNNKGDLKTPKDVLRPKPVQKRESCRVRKKKLPFDEICKNKAVSSRRNRGKKKVTNIKPDNLNGTKISLFDCKAPSKRSASPDCDEGYTLVHTESGDVVVRHNQTIHNKLNSKVKSVKLVHCKNYSVSNKAPYKVEMEVSVLLLVDVHSHLSPKYEVMGLLGGSYSSLDNVLSITAAVPCKTVLCSNIHCDMCPVSQSESSEHIYRKGLSVVGWYHSHPNFDPSPSDTDIDTQNNLQSWFHKAGKPFVGLILSPYYSVRSVSLYRCCHVKMENSELMPYELDVKITNRNSNVSSLRLAMEDASKTLKKNGSIKHINMYKCLESVQLHLKKVSPTIEEDKQCQIVQDISTIFRAISKNI